jgi:hypothetical protein
MRWQGLFHRRKAEMVLEANGYMEAREVGKCTVVETRKVRWPECKEQLWNI